MPEARRTPSVAHALGALVLAAGGVLAIVAVAAPPAAAQQAAPVPDRFAGWEQLPDPEWRFDPDARPVATGVTVRATARVRTVFAAVSEALQAGDLRGAAQQLDEAITALDGQVLAVAGEPGRWVGASEWALFLLAQRIPASVRAELDTPDDLAELEQARAERDEPRLAALLRRLDGRPSAQRAWESLARLAAERGDDEFARHALLRARQLGDLPGLSALAARLEPSPPPAVVHAETGLPSPLAPLWTRSVTVASLGPQNPFGQAPGYHEAPIAPVVPVVSGRVVHVADSISVEALDMVSGRLLWRHAGPLELVHSARLGREWFGLDKYVDGWRKRAVSPYLHSEPLLSDGVLFAVEQAAEAARTLTEFDGIPINWPLPRRRLIALDAADGRVLWRQERPGLGPEAFENRFSAAAPPVSFGSLVLASGHVAEGTIHSYLAAFDRRDGRLVWSTFLASGQQDLTMFNRPFAEHVASGPAVAGADVFVSTNLGVVACVDALTGRLRWLCGYPALERFASRSPTRELRRDVHFVNRPPQVADGRVVVMPLDASSLHVLDASTGRRLRSLPGQTPDSQRHDALLLPDGLLVVGGDAGLEGFDVDLTQRRWSLPIGRPRGALLGALASDGHHVHVPSSAGLAIVDPRAAQLVALLRWEGALAGGGGRRVVPGDLGLVVADASSVYCTLDVDAALSQVLSGQEGGMDGLLAAELLAAAGRPAEAAERYDAVLALGRAQDLVRAASGRLLVELQLAREADSPERWEALLSLAERLGDPWTRAPEALSALLRLGADERADAWLDRLARLDPERPLRIEALTRDGPRPAALFAALRAVARAQPAAAVERLQDLIESFPDAIWEGEPVRAWAARRIGELLDRHGRRLYDRIESLAEEALRRADGSGALAAIEARFPNARAVLSARTRRLEGLLEQGRAFEVLEELSEASPVRAGGGMDALAVLAAERLGDGRVAARLRGEPVVPPPDWLPALPGPGARPEELLVSTRGRVVFPPVRGRPAVEAGGRLVCVVNDVGELLALDAQQARILWRRPLPGGLAYASPGLIEFLQDGELLIVIVHRPRDQASGDLLEAIDLAAGVTRWTRRTERESHDAAVSDGLLWRLEAAPVPDGRGFRATAFATDSGARVAVVDLPACVDAQLLAAGGEVLVFTVGALGSDGRAQDGRLARLDARAGALRGLSAVAGEAPVPVRLVHEPPLVVVGLRPPGGGPGSRLLAFDAAGMELRWNADTEASLVRAEALHAVGGGRLLLDTALRRDGTWWATRLSLFDGNGGRLGHVDLPAQLGLVSGQSVPRSGARPGRAGSPTVPRLLFEDHADSGRFVLVDGPTAAPTHELRIPGGVSGVVRAMQGRDGFALLVEATGQASPGGMLHVFDAQTGKERYSGRLEATRSSASRAPDRPELALAEGVVVTASGGRLTLLRNSAR